MIDIKTDNVLKIKQLFGLKTKSNLNAQLARKLSESLLNKKQKYILQNKLDGIRVQCFFIMDKEKNASLYVVSREFKLIPNTFIRAAIENMLFVYFREGLMNGIDKLNTEADDFACVFIDGEILTYNEHNKIDDFNVLQSKVMSKDGTPLFKVCVFDMLTRNYLTIFDHVSFNEYDETVKVHLEDNEECTRYSSPYISRLASLKRHVYRISRDTGINQLLFTPVMETINEEEYDGYQKTEIDKFHQKMLEMGFEGVIIRNPYAAYHSGRATKTHNEILKDKQTETIDAIILEILPLQKNENDAVDNGTGSLKRSSKNSNKVTQLTAGSLFVQDSKGRKFHVGSGFDDITRLTFWENRDKLIGKVIEVKYMSFGMKNPPRNPVFVRLREDITMKNIV